MARIVHVIALAALSFSTAEMLAGPDGKETIGGVRKEFHLSAGYPYIFRQVGYLQSEGPAPMRYGEPVIDCSHRRAPALPAAAKATPSPSPKPAAEPEKSAPPQAQASPTPKTSEQETVMTAAAPPPAYPAPDNGPTAPPKGSADFNKTPDEVVGYFRNPYNFVPNSHRFFDPIFEPAPPQPAQQGPQSSATYIEKP
jgi:hypothetical protein